MLEVFKALEMHLFHQLFLLNYIGSLLLVLTGIIASGSYDVKQLSLIVFDKSLRDKAIQELRVKSKTNSENRAFLGIFQTNQVVTLF